MTNVMSLPDPYDGCFNFTLHQEGELCMCDCEGITYRPEKAVDGSRASPSNQVCLDVYVYTLYINYIN